MLKEKTRACARQRCLIAYMFFIFLYSLSLHFPLRHQDLMYLKLDCRFTFCIFWGEGKERWKHQLSREEMGALWARIGTMGREGHVSPCRFQHVTGRAWSHTYNFFPRGLWKVAWVFSIWKADEEADGIWNIIMEMIFYPALKISKL